ncbi:hypothetical protein ACP275_09G028400 [Erythranthe tilingii]
MWQNIDQTCISSNGSSLEEASNCNNNFLYSNPTFPLIPSIESPPPPPHLLRAHHQCVATISGQTPYTSSLALVGKFLFAGSADKEIRLLNLDRIINPVSNFENSNNHSYYTVMSGKGAIKEIVVSSDQKLVTAHQDHKIRVWKIIDRDKKIEHLATLPTLTDRAIKVLTPKNHVKVRRHKKLTWVHHADAISSLKLSADGSLLYSASWDRTVKIWRTSDFKCVESISDAHDDAINAVAVSYDGRIYTGSSDKKIKVWRKQLNEKTHSLTDTLEKHTSGINALALSVDGEVLYSGASDRSILVWMNEGGQMGAVGALRGHKKSILCLAIVSDLVCSGSADKTVRVWRGVGRLYSCLAVLDLHKGPVKCISAGIDECNSNPSDVGLSYLVCSASLDCDIKVWRIVNPTI